jgi:XTP/dITP diphosphohydrolase
MQKITIVTGNTKKFTEMSRALADLGIETERLDGDMEEIQNLDGAQVVRDKALKAFALAERPVLVDDSGIYFEKYNNFPGTFSKYLFKAIGYDGILQLVQEGDRATFVCYVAYMDGTLPEPMIMRGEYPGTITKDFPRDLDTEMPYALMYIPHNSVVRMAAMTPEERSLDHRHQALNQFAQWYKTHHE